MLKISKLNIIKAVFYLVTSFCLAILLVPINPSMPTGGLDPSWVLGLNESLTQGYKFGTDIVFTFGPFSSIYTQINCRNP
jgi:hypothetical protein